MLQREAEWTAQKQRLVRTEQLVARLVKTPQDLDDDRAAERGGNAAVDAAKAQVAAAEAAIRAGKAKVLGETSTAEAAAATIARIKADLDDCTLTSPRDGRVQYRITEVGEVLGVGGKVLNVVDLADVYMTFFLPEKDAGHVDVGADARIILDAAPELVIPAKISYVASVAQFTPKTVETATERQKLTFRLKAQIDPELLRKHLTKVKTGLPGVAWAKRDPRAEWPAQLAVKLPE
ncbi:MAG: HlyD family efflux transporter periplasmic adaptor subunit [Terrimicrobiaceae bacterium]